MKKLLSLMLLLIPTIAYSQNYSISSINIYPSFTTIEFIANIDNKLDINMPASFDVSTFKLNYSTSDNITSFKVFKKADNFDTPKHMRSDEKAILKLQKEIDALEGDLESYALKSGLLHNITFEQKDISNLEKSLNTAANLQLANTTKIKELENKLANLKFKYDIIKKDFTSKLPENVNNTIHIEATSNGKGVLRFEATTRDVKWQNIYELSLNSKTGAVNVILLLSLTQRTGLEWKGDMTLHLTNPTTGNINDKLNPQIVTIVPKNQVRVRSTRQDDQAMLYKESNDVAVAMSAPIFDKSLSGTLIKFKADFNSDGISKDIVLDKYSLQSKVEISLTPLLNRYALISAFFDNLTKPFISGSARLYVDNTFSSAVNMQNLTGDDNSKIIFGYTKLIEAKRENLIGKADNGILKGNQSEGYKITVTNQTGAAQTITVVDRIPVSNDSKLNLENLQITPKTSNQEDDGIVKWVLDFDKNGSKDIEVKYNLVYPRDMILIQ